MAFSCKPYQSLASPRDGYQDTRHPLHPTSISRFTLLQTRSSPRHPPHRALMYDLMLVSRVDRGERVERVDWQRSKGAGRKYGGGWDGIRVCTVQCCSELINLLASAKGWLNKALGSILLDKIEDTLQNALLERERLNGCRRI